MKGHQESLLTPRSIALIVHYLSTLLTCMFKCSKVVVVMVIVSSRLRMAVSGLGIPMLRLRAHGARLGCPSLKLLRNVHTGIF